jgi:hypothetical protein
MIVFHVHMHPFYFLPNDCQSLYFAQCGIDNTCPHSQRVCSSYICGCIMRDNVKSIHSFNNEM